MSDATEVGRMHAWRILNEGSVGRGGHWARFDDLELLVIADQLAIVSLGPHDGVRASLLESVLEELERRDGLQPAIPGARR